MYTNKGKDEIQSLFNREFFMSLEEAKSLGMIDEIVKLQVKVEKLVQSRF